MEVQVFGTNKSQDTRKAMRFFSERRVKVHFVDLCERAASRGELTRYEQKFGIGALIDKESARYQDLGLSVVRYSDDRWLQQLCDEPLILRQPLARFGGKLSIGLAETDWAAWVEAGKGK